MDRRGNYIKIIVILSFVLSIYSLIKPRLWVVVVSTLLTLVILINALYEGRKNGLIRYINNISGNYRNVKLKYMLVLVLFTSGFILISYLKLSSIRMAIIAAINISIIFYPITSKSMAQTTK